MNKNITNLKKELREEQMKDYSDAVDRVQISRNGKEVIFIKMLKMYKTKGNGVKNSKYSFHLSAIEAWGDTLVVIEPDMNRNVTVGINKVVRKLIPTYYQKLAQILGMNTVLFRKLPLLETTDLQSLRLKARSEYEIDDWGRYAPSFEYAFEISSGLLQHKMDILKQISVAFKTISQNNPAFQYKVYGELFKTEYLYYYQGKEGVLEFQFNKGKLWIEHGGQSLPIEEGRLLATLEQLVDEIRKKARIHNLYEPPRKIFDTYLHTAFKTPPVKNDIFNALCKYHAASDIDEKVAYQEKIDPTIPIVKLVVGTNEIKLLSVIDVYFVFKNETLIYSNRSKTEASEIFLQQTEILSKEAIEKVFIF